MAEESASQASQQTTTDTIETLETLSEPPAAHPPAADTMNQSDASAAGQPPQKLVSRPSVSGQLPAISPAMPPVPPMPPTSAARTAPLRQPIPSLPALPSIIELPDEAEDDRQPSALFKGVSGMYPKVPSEQWVEEEDFWQTQTHIAMTGRAPVPRPTPRPLRPPQRFRPVARWKSILILAIVLGLAALACIGVIIFGISGAGLLQPGHAATPVPSHTIAPTKTPRK